MDRTRKDNFILGIGIMFSLLICTSCPQPNNIPYTTEPSTSTTPQVISITTIADVTPPAAGNVPTMSINETDQYAGTISWSPEIAINDNFAANTIYTATITITPKADYTLEGLEANSFEVPNATSVSHAANSGIITVEYLITGSPKAVSTSTIFGVKQPVSGAIPVEEINETNQFTGTVIWAGMPAAFSASTIYSATITLTPKAGYTFDGITANFFSVAGASSCTNTVNSGELAVVFPLSPAFVSGNIGNIMSIDAGTFNNGTANMTISSFCMSQHEITGEQFATVMVITDPSHFASISNNPVENVSWYDSIEFCNALSTLEDLNPVYVLTNRIPATGYPITSATVTANWNNNGYRLPTEAEWHFAARGGNNSNDYTYAGSNMISDVAWYFQNAESKTHPVGEKIPNELGLYDMNGNVYEWCWDWRADYPDTEQTDYTGPDSGLYRVARGGCFSSNEAYCNVTDRYNFLAPSTHSNMIGFRVVRP